MTADNFYMFFPLSIMVAVQVHFLVSVYQSYVKVTCLANVQSKSMFMDENHTLANHCVCFEL